MTSAEYHVIWSSPVGAYIVATRHSYEAALLEVVMRQQRCDDPNVEYFVQSPNAGIPAQRKEAA